MIRLIATLLSLITTFLFQAQEYRGRGDYEMDEEDDEILPEPTVENLSYLAREIRPVKNKILIFLKFPFLKI